MIEVQHISKKFGNITALDDVSFSLKEGELVALIGENGAGKSTLMRIICGYLQQNEGEVKIFDQDMNKERLKALSYIGYVPEISSLYGDMSVYDFLKWISGIWRISSDETIINAVKQMNIADVLNQKIETLSKGYKKRLEIASALLHSPQFLILDEPTDGLDPNQKHDIRKFMKQYAKEHIVLVSTHVLEDVDVFDRAIMLSAGKVVKDSSIAEFKKLSRHKDLSEAFRILSSQTRKKV